MQSEKAKLSRRTLLKGMSVLPVIGFAGVQVAQAADLVSIDDPTAKALGYVEVSPVADNIRESLIDDFD